MTQPALCDGALTPWGGQEPSLRRRAALRFNGAGLETIGELLGHADLRTTRTCVPHDDLALEPGDEDGVDGRTALDRL